MSNSLEALIPIINRLQDTLALTGSTMSIDLPVITVVGSQSAGKSSVLESIVGRDFLPRGSGICTRRPLILQLYYHPKVTAGEPLEYGEFLHKPNQRYEKYSDICNEIVSATDATAGTNKGVSPDPIRLKIFSPHVLNLTLIDLPGLTKVPVGDQPADIDVQIRRMVLQYIKRPNAIILAVSAANSDIATSDALQIAREVDPQFERTVGVLTKLDLMDRGTDAGEILHNKAHPLRLGWIAVVNRSQADIDTNLSVSKAREAEEKFFSSHPIYSDIANKNGTPYLSKALNDILISHIQATLPEMRSKIQEQLTSAMKDLESMGSDENETQPEAILLNLINQYSTDFTATIDGKSSGAAKAELFGGARINYIFTEVLDRMISTLKSHQSISAEEIKTIIRNSSGPMPTLFLPDFAFQFLSNRMISDLEGPCVKCLDLVFEELNRICRSVPSQRLKRFQVLRNRIVNSACELLKKLHGPTKKYITDTIKCELSYTNTRHPAFQAVAATEIASLQAGMFKTQDEGEGAIPTTRALDSTEYVATTVLPKLLKAYYEVIRVKVQDNIPKSIMFFLVNKAKEEMQAELVTQLYRSELVDSLLVEDEAVVAKRKSLRELIKVLNSASVILDEVRDIGLTTGSGRNYRVTETVKKPAPIKPQNQQIQQQPVAPQPAPVAQKPQKQSGSSFLNLGPIKN